MSFVPFLLETVLISLSGVMSPGPMSAVTVGKGSESPHAGALIAIGHGAVEFPLILAIFWGFGYVLDIAYVKTGIALVGGILLLLIGAGMFRNLKQSEIQARTDTRYPVLVGILLSVGNPFFLVWWVTVGAALISRSVRFGVWGLLAFALSHWMCDLVWCYFLSALSFRGGRFFGERFHRGVLMVCGAFMLFFGGKYIVDGVGMLLA
jgi:threonine/homoserine/homoserine lactone efflux protein